MRKEPDRKIESIKCPRAIGSDLNNIVVPSRMQFVKQQRETLSFIGLVRSLLSEVPAAPRSQVPQPGAKPVVAANHIRGSKAGFGKRGRSRRHG
jgi:hypothetical protein